MKIKELIKNFEEECLFGENRFRNIILYDNLLDKIEREENMQWNLENIRSYLSIIWYRLKMNVQMLGSVILVLIKNILF